MRTGANLAVSFWAVMLIITGVPTVVRADTSESTYVRVYAPFPGIWGLNGQHPPNHGRFFCPPKRSGNYSDLISCSSPDSVGSVYLGDWGLDYYSPNFVESSPDAVRFNKQGFGGDAQYKGYVWAVMPTCKPGVQAGKTVFVFVWAVSSGYEGWVSYSHLANVAVSAGQWISNGTKLGELRKWPDTRPNSTCWQVSTNRGVHTHIEMTNLANYACYQSYGAGAGLSTSSTLGIVGRTRYSGTNQPC
jgi:hypothetical protein